MRRLLIFRKGYFIAALILFVTEWLIAMYLNDRFVRPYVGDFLVVILIYCFVKSFINARSQVIALAVLVFSFLVETLQYFDIVHRIGLDNLKIATIIIGTSFEWADIIAYSAGITAVLFVEKISDIRFEQKETVSIK